MRPGGEILMKAIDRLRLLEEAKVEMSRNRNFGLFQEPVYKRALTLHRYLDALAEEIREGHAKGSLVLGMKRDERGRVALDLHRTDLSVRHTAHLEPSEIRALAEREGIEAILHVSGILWADAKGNGRAKPARPSRREAAAEAAGAVPDVRAVTTVTKLDLQ